MGIFAQTVWLFISGDLLPVLIVQCETVDSEAASTEDVYLYGSISGVMCVVIFSYQVNLLIFIEQFYRK